MDGYFATPPAPVTLHAPYLPEAVPFGNVYQVNVTTIKNFWSVRDLWFDDTWQPQSEAAIASQVAQVQAPVYVPYESNMIPVVMSSW